MACAALQVTATRKGFSTGFTKGTLVVSISFVCKTFEAVNRGIIQQFAVPESYKVSRQLVLNAYSNIDFKRPHAPLLFIGGGSDNIFPPALTTTLANKYKDGNSKVDLKIFEGKSHFICGEPGWEHVADYIIDWHERG